MDKQKIENLREKRKLLQEEIRLKKIRDRITPQLKYLHEHDSIYKVHYESKHVNWINENLKVRTKDGYRGIHGDFQIDVNDNSCLSATITTEDELLTLKPVAKFLDDIPNDTTFIICSLGGDPELEISKETFISKPSIFFFNPENWIISTDRKFLIESIWEQSVIRFIDISQSMPILKVNVEIEN
jgi:hypothetical protein